jgi:hypothetical protein
MHLSELGFMAEKFWLEIPEHFPFVELSDFVVMPNHVHGIIIINKTDDRFKMNNETNIVDNGNIVGNDGDGGFDGNGGYGENGGNHHHNHHHNNFVPHKPDQTKTVLVPNHKTWHLSSGDIKSA